MRLIKDYIEYLKDNPEGYWFKRKLYGWGWTPAKPAGWIVLGLYVLFILGSALYCETKAGIDNNPGTFITLFLIATVSLIIICWRTGESPKWQWGIKDDDKE